MNVAFFRQRIIAAGLLAATLMCPTPNATAATSPAADPARTELQAALENLAQRARPGLLGISMLDLHGGAAWRINADRAYR